MLLYVDDILLTSNDFDLLTEIEQMLNNHFDMKNLGDTSFVLSIKIFQDEANSIL